MKQFQPLLLVAAGALGTGFALSQDPPKPGANDADSLKQKVEQLEGKIAELESWVEAQQKQAKAMQKSLDAVEAAGFTAGINFESRELLLKALRAEAKEAVGKSEEEDTKRGTRGRRR